ncbi:hypothetical protein ACP70R_033854 [Stipagrostis hirtigluma subsp. patula]
MGDERTLRPNEPRGPTTAVAEAPSPPQDAPAAVSSGDETDGEFEFPFVSRDSPAGTAALADELFADGRIRPFYPVFGRSGGGGRGGGVLDDAVRSAPTAAPRVRGQLGRLFLEESRSRVRSSSTSSTASSTSALSAATEDDDGGGLDGAPPESYCLWTPGGPGSSASPSTRPPRKSSSTGSMARWRRISELVVGRSHSDGREKFLFLPTRPHVAPNKDKSKPKPSPAPAPAPAPAGGRKASVAAATEADTVAAAHRTAYLAKGGGGGGVPVGTPRRTFLPYREELVGFFANVNGVSRSHHHPF